MDVPEGGSIVKRFAEAKALSRDVPVHRLLAVEREFRNLHRRRRLDARALTVWAAVIDTLSERGVQVPSP